MQDITEQKVYATSNKASSMSDEVALSTRNDRANITGHSGR